VISQWTPARLGNLSGKRIIVTGATNGVGLGTARALARAGAHVVLAVRNLELGAQRANEIGGDTSIVKLDLADQSSVRAFPDFIDGDVDIVINNAGLVAQNRSETVDGFESTIGTNFLGPFALTNLLFDRVRSKIINVGSDAHKSSTIAFDDPHLRSRRWSAFPAYGRSKLAVMLWGLELDRRLRAAGSPIRSYLTHPGFVSSNLSKVSDTSVMSGFHKGGSNGGQRGRQRHRRGRSANPVLHHRADPARQLCGHRRQVRVQGGPDAEWPDIERMRLRGCRQAVRVRRKRNQDNTSRLTAMT
jgi:NAD(P)-dependent dehydrogenase (short-subunit alcohol dehydrogenase family)